MGYDTKSRVQKMMIGGSNTPSDIWVDNTLVKEIYSDTTRVYNSIVYCHIPSEYDIISDKKLYYSVKLGSTTTQSGELTPNCWLNDSYAFPEVVNGAELGFWGLEIGYGASIEWKISGVPDGFGIFRNNGRDTKSITYDDSSVSKRKKDDDPEKDAYLSTYVSPREIWGIERVYEKVLNNIVPFKEHTTNGIAINASFPSYGQDTAIEISASWWTKNDEINSEGIYFDPSESSTIDGYIDVPQNSTGCLAIKLTGVQIGWITRDDVSEDIFAENIHIPFKVGNFSNPYQVESLNGFLRSRTTKDGYKFSVSVGTRVSNPYGSGSWDAFDCQVESIYSYTPENSDVANVLADVTLYIGVLCGKSTDYNSDMDEEPMNYSGTLYVGSYHKDGTDSLNDFLKGLSFKLSAYYGEFYY